MHIPVMATCQQCGRTLPIRAQMQVQGRSLPMLVVPSQVDSVEAALEQATCQVCLARQGSIDRGLYEVLKTLGLNGEDNVSTPPRETTVVVRPAAKVTAGTGVAVVISAAPREVVVVDPLMGTSIAVQPRLSLPARTRVPHRDDWRPAHSEPKLPRAMRGSERCEPTTKVEHLTGKLGKVGGNAAVLEAAKAGIRERDEERLCERAEKFEKLTHWLKLTLAKIRKRAQAHEVWDLVDTFERKLGEAVAFDTRKRGRKGLLAMLGTSTEEFEAFCLEFYLAKGLLHFDRPVEVITMDAFEGGCRPEFWDNNGCRRPAFYEFEVVRTKRSLPIPSLPLPSGDKDSRQRIIYPDGGQFGPDYTIERSRHLTGIEDDIDKVCEGAARVYQLWLGEWHNELRITGSIARIDLSVHIPAFFRDAKGVLRIMSRSKQL